MFTSDKKYIGSIIKAHRELFSLTQAQLAEKTGLSEKEISRIESGKNYPTYLSFVKFIDSLNINIEEFMNATSKTQNTTTKEIEFLIKNSTDDEQKMFLGIIKVIKHNLKK